MEMEKAAKKSKYINIALLLAFLLLVISPLILNQTAEFAGADGEAEAQIIASNPDYQPWFNSLWEPPSGEIESLLFAAQASIGTGFIAYFFGLMRGRKQGAKH